MNVLQELEVRVCGRFTVLVGGREQVLPTHAQRLLAYLSIDRQARAAAHRRSDIAEKLWPDVEGSRAQSSLRTALWRVRRVDRRLVDTPADALRLGAAVAVDVHRLLRLIERLQSEDVDARPAEVDVDSLQGDLLVGWEEDWLLLERERIRQGRIHALEALSRRLQRTGQHAQAIDAALAAVAAEPLRESAHATLIAAYLADRDHAAAYRQLHGFAELLDRELGVRPSRELMDIVRQP